MKILLVSIFWIAGISACYSDTQCSQISSEKERLACYDKANSQPAPNSDNWTYEENRSDLDKSKTVGISTVADRVSVGHHIGSSPSAAWLFIICEEHQTRLLVAYSDNVSYDRSVSVKYRAGNDPVISGDWDVSQRHTAYGFWNSKKAVPLIKRLMVADDFFIRAEANTGGTSEALFKLQGLESAVKPVREACNW